MGYAVKVDSERVAAQGAELIRISGEVDQVAEAVGRILLAMAGAGGGGAVSLAAQGAASRWSATLARVAAQGSCLGQATQLAAQQYAEVERLHTGIWAVGGGTRWGP